MAGQIGPMMEQMKQKFMEGMQKAMDFGKNLMAGMKVNCNSMQYNMHRIFLY